MQVYIRNIDPENLFKKFLSLGRVFEVQERLHTIWMQWGNSIYPFLWQLYKNRSKWQFGDKMRNFKAYTGVSEDLY